MGAESGVWKVKSGVWRVKSGEWRVKSGAWRVELKALVCLPCKGGGPQSGGGVLIKRVESGERRPKGAASPLTDVLNPHRAECGKLRAEFGEWSVESGDRCTFLISNC